MFVLLVHLRGTSLMPGGPPWFQRLASLGYLGVSFFFVLSGFILVYTYSGRDFTARDFWHARFARIYPAYATSLIVALPMFSWVLVHLNFPFLAWMKEHLSLGCVMVATLTQSWVPQIASAWNPVAWSLSVEAFFYLCFPVLFATMSRSGWRSPLIWMSLAWATSLVITGGYVVLAPDGVAHTTSAFENLFWLNVVRFNPLVCLPQFVLGMAAGFLFLRLRVAISAGTWIAIAGLAGFVISVTFSEQIPYPMLHSGLLAPAFAAIIFGVALSPSWAKFLEAPWLVLLGEASYSLYLLHFSVVWAALVLFGRAAATPAMNLAVAATAILLSIASYKGIEQPARRWLRTLNTREAVAATA
jgi:peptidoglycan/LPS O-acetylase OafA/YrhL